MSLLDLASLVLAPTATKEGKVYSAIPDTGQGDMTFTRGSSATRVNSAGLIEKERANLLLQSNTFDTSWSVGGTISGGQDDKDGGSSAWSFTSSSPTSGLSQTVSVSGVKTLSAYIKKNDTYGVRIYMFGTTNVSPYINLDNGTVVSLSNAIDVKIVEYNADWWRVSVTTPDTSTNSVYFYVTNNSATQTTGTITLQDAQLEQGLVAQPYIQTTTTAVYEGITDDVPRVDYSGGGCPSLLLEPQRTNVVTQSEYFGAWTESGLTITDNNATSPEGVLNAAKLTLPSGSATKRIALGSMPVTAVARSYSFFVKSDDITAVQLVHSGDLQGYARFDISTGVVGSSGTKTTSNIEDYGNGWYRCIANFDSSNAFGSTIYLYISDSATGGYGGSTSAEGDLFVYGAQYEEGNYSTSYLPTYGTSTTRVQDSCSKTGISELIGQTEGTLFAEVSGLSNDTVRFAISDGTNSNNIYIELSSSTIAAVGRVSAVNQFAISSSQTITNLNKIAVKYKENDFALWINGVEVGTDSSGSTYSANTLSAVKFDRGDGGIPFYGNMEQMILFPNALTDTQLEELTK